MALKYVLIMSLSCVNLLNSFEENKVPYNSSSAQVLDIKYHGPRTSSRSLDFKTVLFYKNFLLKRNGGDPLKDIDKQAVLDWFEQRLIEFVKKSREMTLAKKGSEDAK